MSDLRQANLLWLFEGRRYVRLHAHHCGIPRAVPQIKQEHSTYNNLTLESTYLVQQRLVSKPVPLP